ncbi:GH3 family domain-containing protein [Fodinibius salsisoli]|uniref:GH3 auxin-responsive promoter family protein n=1 Tax=Fodinibius salsisoli TaxID=2820877 RepID=A0ABT3PLI0_9BACT|nr:GH3 auxin-responsive promoter family protein [Fodinibius salsisoli]MCW9706821.1 GH3 auxin-responsive promoter family protein [Fodinibius salsisoli]
MDIRQKQEQQLFNCIRTASDTVFGQKHQFGQLQRYEDFKKEVGIASYDEIKSAIQRLKKGEKNLLWPGRVHNFAVSSGTSGEGKHLPITEKRLSSDRRFMQKVVGAYLLQRPNIFKLVGSHLSMPGSVEQHDGFEIGEISGFTALNAPAWLRYLQVADPQKLTELSFQQKFDLLVDKALNANLKVITAVPSWILTLFQHVLKKTGKQSIAEVWPNLKLLVCGGVKLANYKPHLEQLAEGLTLDFIETYGASEGYIGYSDDLKRLDLKMVIDNGIFFECIPNPKPGPVSSIKETIPLWEVEKNTPYGLLMSTNAGLWRYTLNDIIEFTSVDPLRFVVKGRVNDMLDEYGEALYIYEAEQALKSVTQEFNKEVGTFTIAPFLQTEKDIPHHRWYVQFIGDVSEDILQTIATKIDHQLCQINRHYAIRRESKALGHLEIKVVTQAEINRWMKKQGSANAQSKLPKILPPNTKL